MAPLLTAKVVTERLPVENRARDHGLWHAPHASHAAPRLLTAAELADYDRLGYILRPSGGARRGPRSYSGAA
jgi:hypothetical protein